MPMLHILMVRQCVVVTSTIHLGSFAKMSIVILYLGGESGKERAIEMSSDDESQAPIIQGERRSPRLANRGEENADPPGVARARVVPNHAIAGIAGDGAGRGQARGRGGRGGRSAGRGGGAGRGGVSRGGGSGPRFTMEEIEYLLVIVERILPIGPNDWGHVVGEQLRRFPDKERNELSLRRQFQKLYRRTAPTGNPYIPPHVLEAKRIQRLIEERADATNMAIPGNLGFADELPPEAHAANANPQDVVGPNNNNAPNNGANNNAPPQQNLAANNNIRPVINLGGRSNNTNTSLTEIMQLMVMRSEEERVERAACATAERDERRKRQEERNRWMQQITVMQQQSQMMMMRFLDPNNNNNNGNN